MPSPGEVTHLLRRTEFVAWPERVAELAAKPSLEAAVDDVLSVQSNPPPLSYASPSHGVRIVEVTNSWLDRMAHDSPRPLQEKLALFWHGHFVSDDAKAGNTAVLADQLNLYRRNGLTNLRQLAIDMSTTVAMLRYLDNDRNYADAPNQNFGRELMELFLLGVGNYTEADVEAATAAWTGHTVGTNGAHQFQLWIHDSTPRPFLGRTTCQGVADQHGPDTIRTILGNGVVPPAANVNAGRATRDVAAEFVSRKLWHFFAGTHPSNGALNLLATTARDNDFQLRPWLRRLLTLPEFYFAAVRQGLLRAPVDYVVALLSASGLRSDPGTPWWLLEGMGQRLLFPPNVAGWGFNGYFLNTSAFGQRAAAARHVAYYVNADYWDGAGMRLGRGTLSRAEVMATPRAELVGRITELMGITLGATSRAALDEFANNARADELHDLVELIFVTPEMSVA